VAIAAPIHDDPVRRGVGGELRKNGWVLFLVWMVFVTGAYFLVQRAGPPWIRGAVL
jgi:hypothetical protein